MGSTTSKPKPQREDFKHGYAFVQLPPGFETLVRRMQETVAATDLKTVVAKSPIERAVTSEEISAGGDVVYQRRSLFMSPEFSGPLEQEDVKEVARMLYSCVPEWLLLTRHRYEKRPWAIGWHHYPSYDPTTAGVPTAGLHAHHDVDVVTVLFSTGPLEGFIDGEWQTIVIPDGHAMIFIGLIGALAHGIDPLLHRVPAIPEGKFSVGAFIGPDFDQPIAPGATMQVGDVYSAYFGDQTQQSNGELLKRMRAEALNSSE